MIPFGHGVRGNLNKESLMCIIRYRFLQKIRKLYRTVPFSQKVGLHILPLSKYSPQKIDVQKIKNKTQTMKC